MSRSLKKGPYVDEKLLRRIERMEGGKKEPLKVFHVKSIKG